MAFSSIVRRASASIFPVAIRSVASQLRPFHGAISTVGSNEVGRRFSSTAATSTEKQTTTLVRLLESEIQLTEQLSDVHADNPDRFPFIIEEDCGDTYLRGKYQDEKIDVTIYSPHDILYGSEKELTAASLGLFVTISKEDNVHNLSFRLTTTSPNEITIEKVNIIKGPAGYLRDCDSDSEQDFNDLDENLQKFFHKYLEIGGIKHTELVNLILEYKRKEDKEDNLLWLKGVKAFMEGKVLKDFIEK